MTVNPQVEALLAAMAAAPPIDYGTVTAAEMRALFDRPLGLASFPDVVRTEDIVLALSARDINARLYVPQIPETSPPLTLYFHGGGWVMGTLDTHDATCRALARSSGSAILSVAYRLAPEYPFPAGLEDCYEALLWAAGCSRLAGIDTARLAVAGDSAGANLAAAAAILARDRGGPRLAHQLLVYPVADRNLERESYLSYGGGDFFLTTEAMRWFWDAYLRAARSPDLHLASIIEAPDLAGLPPATIIAAEYDPLRDEALAFGERLSGAGVPTEISVAPGMVHGFFSLFDAVPDALPWIDRAGRRLRDALA